jgi:hypothetical protein
MMSVFGGLYLAASGLPICTAMNPDAVPVRFVGVVGVPRRATTAIVGARQNWLPPTPPNWVETGHGATWNGNSRGAPICVDLFHGGGMYGNILAAPISVVLNPTGRW